MHLGLFKRSDITSLQQLCDKHYKDEFAAVDVLNDKTLQLYTVTNNNDLICIGGIQSLVELDIVMNKDLSIENRRDASHMILQAAIRNVCNMGYKQLHAFVQDEKFLKHLEKLNFNPTKGKGLVLNL
jgi:hypothetical protein